MVTDNEADCEDDPLVVEVHEGVEEKDGVHVLDKLIAGDEDGNFVCELVIVRVTVAVHVAEVDSKGDGVRVEVTEDAGVDDGVSDGVISVFGGVSCSTT